MMAAMETVSVPIDDHTVVIVVVPIMAVVMWLGLDDDAFFCGRDRRCSQAKRQCAKDDGLHFEFSKNLKRPSVRKLCSTTLVPASIETCP
ncbi:hypothetical protein X727_21300 [Mesorhizobium sp. L103C119B0]|nr:hypothetical protein X727_21300 [Mesorhizobium sp. L103C119B0]